MNIFVKDDFENLSLSAKDIILDQIKAKKDTLLCAATGSSPTRTYELMAEEYAKNPRLFDQLKIIKLDEWGNIAQDHPKTCESYLQKYVIRPMHIPDSRYISFISNSQNPQEECDRIQEELKKNGPIDLCILGLGMNGHLALNEPADYLQKNCHVASLSHETMQHPMAAGMETKPTYGLTLGMADILHSKKILLLIHGTQKKSITTELFSGKITSSLPASFLWLHPNVICLVEKDAME